MTLPSLQVQFVYAHLAWGVVLAACGTAILARRKPFPVRLGVAWVILMVACNALPGNISLAYWLGFAFQSPSALLVAYCVAAVWQHLHRRVGDRLLSTGAALTIVGVGGLLYVDAAGLLHLGLYTHGYGGMAAGVALTVGTLAAIAVNAGPDHRAARAVLFAVTLFALWRLPTGNAWDAFLDPWLFLWALATLIARGVAGRARQLSTGSAC